MKIGKIIGVTLAICFAGSIYSARAQTTSLTQQILQKHTFREGLVWIGDKESGETENEKLMAVLNTLSEPSWTTGLEQFLTDYPQSPWAASLHYDYASFCRRTGRTTKALEHYQAAWMLTKNDTSAQGQRLGGAVLANWTDLLSSLGRSDQLKALIAEGRQWHFTSSPARDKFQGAINSYELMQLHPGIAYRCGTFALKAAGQILQPTNQELESLVQLPSPTNGFTLAGLSDLAKQYGLNMVAVRRTAGQDLIVPSVVHWRQNHYAAILGKKGDLYQVSDPTFGNEKWLTAEVINEEASGEFLIPASQQTDGWTQLVRNDAKMIHGMGLPDNVKDGKDKGCQTAGKCPACHGMPVWWVTEPYINVWLADKPLSYLTSRGQPVDFQITYKQRDSRPAPTEGSVSTAGWNNSWASYVVLEADAPRVAPQLGASSSATVFLANGGEVDFNLGQNYDSETGIMLVDQFPPSAASGGFDIGQYGLRAVHVDGSQDVYGLAFNDNAVSGDLEESVFLLTRHIDANGDTTWFDYTFVNPLGPWVLTSVVDSDGRTNTLAYNSNNLLLAVTNGYGQSAHFKYDSSGNLTNIVDAQQLSSSITYDTNGYPTSLITPYGTTTFSIFANSTVATTNDGEGNFGGDDLIDRSVLVTDPIGANYLYMYRYDCSSASPVDMSPTFPSGSIPVNTPLGTLDTGAGSSTNTLAGVCYRNSFYWGPRQYPTLSTTAMTNFTANDYIRGRMQHWLEDTNQLYLTGYLSVEQDASPDGSTPGLLTFYDYQGKQPGYNFCAGTNAVPSVTAWRLPSGETHYEYLQFDYFGNITNDITTYTMPGGGLGTRTNQFVYTGNTYTYVLGTWNGSSIVSSASTNYTVPDLLTKVIGADGNPIWSYGGFDTVTWTNFFLNGGTTNASTLTALRVLPDFTTNGLGQVTTTTFSAGGTPVTYSGNIQTGTTFPGYSKITGATTAAGLTTTNFYNINGFLMRSIDLQIGRTNTYGYTTDGMVGSLTNALGLNVTATWDNLLRLTSVQFPDGTYISNLYSRLDLAASKDRLTNWTYYGYDGARHLTSVTNANNAVTTLEWCDCGALTAVIDPLNNTNSFNYDNQGNLTNITYPDGSIINRQYNLAAWPTTISDGAGRVLQLAYNNQGLVTNVTCANGTLDSIVYDALDRPVSVTDANSITVTNSFDVMGKLLARTWADGIPESYGYNAAGLIAYTNRDGKATYFTLDSVGRKIAETNANKEVIRFAYNPLNNLTNLWDGNTNQTHWQFNQYGWLTNKIDSLGRNAFRYAYNPNGWLTNRVTPEKGTTTYTYDNVGNVKSILYPQSSILYSYNGLNHLTNMVDAVGTNVFSYTPLGEVASETGPWTSNTVNYTYTQGLRTALSLSQPGGTWSQSYAYDSGWRLQTLTSPAGNFTYNYNFQPASALVTAISLPNGASITNGYDALGRLRMTALNNHWGHTLDAYSYIPDALGLRTNILRNLGLTTNSVNAGYDNIGQLTSWSASDVASSILRQNEQLTFGYDPAHNLHSRANGVLSQTFTTDTANELTNVVRNTAFTMSGATPSPATNVTVNGQTAAIYGDFTFAGTNLTLLNGQNTFTNVATFKYGMTATNTFAVSLPQNVALNYDNNGNLTNDGSRTFAYDSENQLTNVTVANAFRKDLVFDGLNRIRIKREFSWTSGVWTLTNEVHFIYDGNVIIQHRNSNNVPTLTLTRGLDLSGSRQGAGGVGSLLAMTDGSGANYYYHQDGLGSVTALMDASENIVARREMDGFGRTINLTGNKAAANPYWYLGQLYDESSRLVHFKGREYSPDLMRWLSNDPKQEVGGINQPSFAFNSPVNNIDTDGRQVTGVAGASTGTGVATTTGTASSGGAGTTITVTAGESSVAEASSASSLEALGPIGYSLAGGALIGELIGVDRDAETYPYGVNGPAVRPFPAPAPVPIAPPLPAPAPLPGAPTPPATPKPKDCPPKPPRIFYHYSPKPDLTGGGLKPNQWVTDTPGLSYDRALAITYIQDAPNPIYQYPVTVPDGTPMEYAGRVNGLNQWQLPAGTPPGTVGAATPVYSQSSIP